MTALAQKATEWVESLGMDRPVSEFQLRQMIRDAKSELARVDPHLRWPLQSVLSVAFWRLGDVEKSFEYAQEASKGDPQGVAHCNQMAAALLGMGRADEAIGVLLAALKLPPIGHSTVVLFGNLAEAFHRVGDGDAAAECMEKAIANAVPDSPRDQVAIANQLAELGENHRAVIYIAQYLSQFRGQAVSVKDAARCEFGEHEEAVLFAQRGLRRLIQDLRKFGFERASAKLHPERDGRDAVSLLDEMRPSIGRANASVLT